MNNKSMNNKSIIILIVLIALGLLGWLWLQSGDNTSEHNETQSDTSAVESTVMPAVNFSDVESWSIDNATGEHLSFARSGDQWVLLEKGNYPADKAKVFRALQTILSADVLEAKTANPDYFDQLGLQSLENENSRAQLLTINGSAMLLIGKSRQFGGDDITYVRKPDGEQTWQVSSNLRQNMQLLPWLNKNVLNVAREQIKSVDIRHADGSVLSVNRLASDQQNFAVDDVPEGRELLYDEVGGSLTTALTSLQFENVEPAQADFDSTSTTVFTLFDDTVITAELNDQQQLQMTVEGDSDQAQSLREAVKGWQFKIAAMKADFFRKRMDDLLKPLPEVEGEASMPEAEANGSEL